MFRFRPLPHTKPSSCDQPKPGDEGPGRRRRRGGHSHGTDSRRAPFITRICAAGRQVALAGAAVAQLECGRCTGWAKNNALANRHHKSVVVRRRTGEQFKAALVSARPVAQQHRERWPALLGTCANGARLMPRQLARETLQLRQSPMTDSSAHSRLGFGPVPGARYILRQGLAREQANFVSSSES